MHKVAFSRRLGGFASIVLFIPLFCPFVTRANAGDVAEAALDAAPAMAPDPMDRCGADDGCVPASCCHPTSCVPRGQRPDCAGIFCTLECRPGTMDCGQGHCVYWSGSCVAVIGEGE